MLERLRGGLIVSIQPEPGSPLDTPETVALFARCAVANGAVGVRIEGGVRIAAVRAVVAVPIVGLVKRSYPGFEPYITPTERELDEVAAAGAEIIAFDATARPRPTGLDVAASVAAIDARGAAAMADCATAEEMRHAAAAGAAIVATTLCGYTGDTRGARLPALDLLAAAGGAFVIAEGGVATPDDVRRAFAAGAAAVVVGTAISNVDALVRSFAQAAPRHRAYPEAP
jgi:N-acylglucosamine-6-phosphate 2-epimerase